MDWDWEVFRKVWICAQWHTVRSLYLTCFISVLPCPRSFRPVRIWWLSYCRYVPFSAVLDGAPLPLFQCFCLHLLGWGPRSPLIFSPKFSQLFLLYLSQLSESISPSWLSFRPQNQSSPADLSLPGPHMSRMYPNPISFSSTALPNLHVSHSQLSWSFPPPPWPLQLIHLLFSASSKDSQEGSAHTVQERNNYWITFGFSFKRFPSSCQRFAPLR